MKCPHCQIAFHPALRRIKLGQDTDGDWGVEEYHCPNPSCNRIILFIIQGSYTGTNPTSGVEMFEAGFVGSDLLGL